jgi:CheY-like chemotaxis protein
MQTVDANNHRLTVLLANEQEGWHQTVRQLLEPQGVQTVSARSGREALNLLESRPIHVAVLDAQMPQLGGLQVMKLMREMQERRGTVNVPPAILLANQLTTHLLHDALSMHVFSVLSKPVDFNVLLDTLARVLRRHYENRWPSDFNGESPEQNGANGNGSANGSQPKIVAKAHRVVVNGAGGAGNGSNGHARDAAHI